MLRRRLAGFLAAVMLCSSIPANVWAEDIIIEHQQDDTADNEGLQEETLAETALSVEPVSGNDIGEAQEEILGDLIEDWGIETSDGEAIEAKETERDTEKDTETEKGTETDEIAEAEESTESDEIEDVIIGTETESERQREAESETAEDIIIDELAGEEMEQAFADASAVICDKPALTGTMKTGEAITCTPHVSGGSGVYAYNYWLFDSAGNIVLRKENTFDTTWTFTAPKGGVYLLRTYATDFATEHYNDTDWFLISGNDVTVGNINLTGEAKEGSVMTVRPTVSGGSGVYAYNYWLFDSNGTIVLRKENTFDTEWSFNAPKSGVYLMRVYATDFTTEHYNDTSWFYIEENKVTVEPVAVTDGIKGGRTMRIVPEVSGGSGTYAYNYWLFDSAGNIVQRVENTFASSVDMTMPVQGGVYLVRVYATDFTTEAYNDSAWFYVNPTSCLDAPTVEGWQEEQGEVWLQWYVDEPADAYVIYEVINGELVYLSSTGKQYIDLTGVTAGMHSYQVCAAKLENGSWIYGEPAEVQVRVYEYENAQTPVMYIEKGTDAGSSLGWFDTALFCVGTTTSLDKVDGPKTINYTVEFLKDNAVVAEGDSERVWMNFYEDKVQFGWYAAAVWKQAYDQQATMLRISLETGGRYLLDEERSTILIPLERQSETAGNPKVNCFFEKAVEAGVTQTIVFQSDNPSDLTDINNTVKVWKNGELLGEARLTEDNPRVEFAYVFQEYEEAEFLFEYTYGDKTVRESSYITSTALSGFEGDGRLRIGGIGWLYPDFWGERLDVAYSSSNENVVKVTSDEYGDAEITGIAAGVSVITVTTPGGNKMSSSVVVYDPSDVETPSIYLGVSEDELTLHDIPLCVGTTTEVSKISSSFSARFLVTFLDENNQAVLEKECREWIDFMANPLITEWVSCSEIGRAYYMGAKKIKVTVLPGSEEEYVIEEGKETVELSMQKIEEIIAAAEKPTYALWQPQEALPGELIEIGIVCLNPEKIVGEQLIKIEDDNGNLIIQGELTSVKPELKVSVKLPEDNYWWYFNAHDEEWDIDLYGSVKVTGGDMTGGVIAVGDNFAPHVSFWHDSDEPIYYQSSDPGVAEVDSEGYVRGLRAGIATITATQGSAAASTTVRVYDLQQEHSIPNIYVHSSGNVQWFEDIPVAIGTGTEISQLGAPINVVYRAIFLKDGNEIPTDNNSMGVWCEFLEQESQYYLGIEQWMWKQALKEQATEVRLELCESSSSEYTVDPNQASITFSLPDKDTIDSPVIIYSVPDAIETGQEFKVVFECINPEKLKEYDNTVTVKIEGGETKQAVLSVENPIAEFSLLGLTESFWIDYDYPVTANGISGGGKWISVSELQSIGNDVKLQLNGSEWIYPSFSEDRLELTFESSDESVVTVEGDEYGNYRLIAGEAGSAVVTARTPAGNEKSITVVVYDPDMTETPVIYLMEAETGDTAGWNEVPIRIGTTTEPEKIGGSFAVRIGAEFLNEADETVRSSRKNVDVNFVSSVVKANGYFYEEMVNAHYNGATQVRLTLLASDYDDYIIDESQNQSIILPMAEVEDALDGGLISIYPDKAVPGETVQIGVASLKAEEVDSVYQVRIYDDDGNLLAEGTLDSDNPEVLREVTIPEDQEYNYRCRIALESEDYNDEYWHYISIPLLGGTISNEIIAIGDTVDLDVNFWQTGTAGEEIVYTSDNTDVAEVDAYGEVTGISEGVAEITATAGAIALKALVRVYDPEIEYDLPVIFIEGKTTELQWFESVPFALGTASDLQNMGGSTRCSVVYTVDFLKNGESLGIGTRESYYYKLADMRINSTWGNERKWTEAFEAGATQVRITLEENEFSYNVDPNRKEIICTLPSPEDYEYPVVSCTYPEVAEPGTDFKVVFRCVNPDKLVNGDPQVQVTMNGESSEPQYLSAENPVAAIEFPLPEGENGFSVLTVKPSGGNLSSHYFWVSISELEHIGADRKLALEERSMIYPSFSYSSLKLTYESSDENIVSVGLDEDGNAEISGVSVGQATVTATTPAGNQRSITVVVYDPDDTVTPAIYLEPAQAGETVMWNEYSVPVHVATATDVNRIGGGFHAYFDMEYLDENDEVVWKSNNSASAYVSFVTENKVSADTFYNEADMENACYRGAKKLRLTLRESGTQYTLSEGENMQAILPIQDLAETSGSRTAIIVPQDVMQGEVMKIGAASLKQDEFFEETTVTVKVDGEILGEGRITAEQPEYMVEVAVPSDRTNSYAVYITTSEDSSYTYVPVLHGSVNDVLLNIGQSSSISASLYSNDDSSIVYSISDSEIAEIDSASGTITGKKVGCAVVTATKGRVSASAAVRVYDSNAEHTRPILYLKENPKSPGVRENSNVYYWIGTTTPLEELGGYTSFSVACEYLTDEELAVYREVTYGSLELASDLEERTVYVSQNVLRQAVAGGATHIRLSLMDDGYGIIDAENNSCIIPITEIWEGTDQVVYGSSVSLVSYADFPVEAKAKVLNPDKLGTSVYTYTVSWDSMGEDVIGSSVLSAQNPEGTITFESLGDGDEISFYGRLTDENGELIDSWDYDIPIVRFSESSDGIVMNVGDLNTKAWVTIRGNSINTNNYGGTIQYVSNDETIVTVNQNGGLTAVAPGMTTVTITTGPLTKELKVRVYDTDRMENAELSFRAAEGYERFSWSGEGAVAVDANLEPGKLGPECTLHWDASYDVNGTSYDLYSGNGELLFADTNSETLKLSIPYSSMVEAAERGAAAISFTFWTYSSYFTVGTANVLTIPLTDLEQTDDPLISVSMDEVPDILYKGSVYAVGLNVQNPAFTTSVPVTVTASGNFGEFMLGRTMLEPGNIQGTVELFIPEEAMTGSYTLKAQMGYSGAAKELVSRSCSIAEAPVVASSVSELESDHPYANGENKTWSFQYAPATKLTVTFDEQTEVENNYDHIHVLNDLSGRVQFSGTELAGTTLDVGGNKLDICLTSDGSVTKWGFKVAKVVATLSDGSTIEVTEAMTE